MTITRELLDELLSGVENANDLLGDKGLMKELKVRLMERMLGAELTENLATSLRPRLQMNRATAVMARPSRR